MKLARLSAGTSPCISAYLNGYTAAASRNTFGMDILSTDASCETSGMDILNTDASCKTNNLLLLPFFIYFTP